MIDPFDRVQLEYVIEVCRKSASLSDAGRTLFAASRTQRKSTNDADRLRKYLARFDLDWNAIAQYWRAPTGERGRLSHNYGKAGAPDNAKTSVAGSVGTSLTTL